MTMNPSSSTLIIALLITLLLSACVAQNFESCSICGEGMEVGNPDGQVTFPGRPGQIPCGILENMGSKFGLIPPPQCAVLPQLIGITCECQSSTGPTIPATTTPGPVTTTDATKPGGSKSGKSIGHSMSVPAKAGKSTVISTKAIKASSSAKAEKSSSSGGSKGGKGWGGSKGGKGSVHDSYYMSLNQLTFSSAMSDSTPFGAPVYDTTASTSPEFRNEDLITLLKWIVDSSSPAEDKAEPQGEATEEVEVLEDIRAQLVELNENFKKMGN